MTPTTQELQGALEAMRRRPAHRYWPDTMEAVLANPIQARLVRIEAILRRRRFKPAPYRMQTLPPVAMDRKRAAAGDIDD